MEGVKEKVIRGATWSTVSRFSGLLLRIGPTAILTRPPRPQEFGPLATVPLFCECQPVHRFRFTVSLEHRKEIDEELTSSVFWLNFGMARLIFLAFLRGAHAVFGYKVVAYWARALDRMFSYIGADGLGLYTAPMLQLAVLVPISVAADSIITALTPGPAYFEIRQYLASRRSGRVQPAAES